MVLDTKGLTARGRTEGGRLSGLFGLASESTPKKSRHKADSGAAEPLHGLRVHCGLESS